MTGTSVASEGPPLVTLTVQVAADPAVTDACALVLLTSMLVRTKTVAWLTASARPPSASVNVAVLVIVPAGSAAPTVPSTVTETVPPTVRVPRSGQSTDPAVTVQAAPLPALADTGV